MARKLQWVLPGGLAIAALGQLLVPVGSPAQSAHYMAVSALALGAAVVGVRLHRPRRMRIWIAFLAGLACQLLGDVLWFVQETVLDVAPFPSVADVAYLAGYPLMALGLAFLVAGRQRARDHAALLDALTIATGIGLVTAVVVIQPAVTDLGDGVLAPILASAYPLADVLLLAVAARLWFTPCRTLPAYHLLMASIAAQLIGDIGYNAVYLAGGGDLGTTGFGLMLLLTYVGVAATTLHPSVRTISEPAPAPVERLTRGRLAVLALTSILAPAAMITNGALGLPLYWEVVGPGSILLLVLVLARVAGLVQQVQRQAVQLAALARNDALTGVPNRRTWDHELSRACAAARDQDTLLSVALLDLDNFKRFNDTSGHAAGDLLLKSATAAWRSVLADDAFLARYGGEEFTVLFPGRTASEAYAELDTLRSVTPMGQNFSAGVATWDTAEQPAVLVARADALLYEAKRSGRGRTLPLPLPLPLPTSADLTGRTDISGQRDSHR